MSIDKYFTRPDFSVPRRLITLVCGQEGTGKTHFALTASELGPTAYVDTDINAEGVWQKFQDRDLWRVEIQPGSAMVANPASGENEYEREWTRFKEAFSAAIADPQIKVIIGDNWTEIWELCRLNFFGRLTTIQRNFGPPNAAMRYLIRDAKSRADLSLIAIQKVTNEYVNDKSTGLKVPAGFKEMPYLVQLVVECWKKDHKFGITVVKSTHKPEMEGLELVEPMATFPILMSMIHGG